MGKHKYPGSIECYSNDATKDVRTSSNAWRSPRPPHEPQSVFTRKIRTHYYLLNLLCPLLNYSLSLYYFRDHLHSEAENKLAQSSFWFCLFYFSSSQIQWNCVTGCSWTWLNTRVSLKETLQHAFMSLPQFLCFPKSLSTIKQWEIQSQRIAKTITIGKLSRERYSNFCINILLKYLWIMWLTPSSGTYGILCVLFIQGLHFTCFGDLPDPWRKNTEIWALFILLSIPLSHFLGLCFY